MSPEYKVYVPDAGFEDFVSSVKQIEGAKILSVDKNSNEVLALKVRDVVSKLPDDTYVYFMSHWKESRLTPESWKNFIEDLPRNDRGQIIRFLGLTLRQFRRRENYLRDKMAEERGDPRPIYTHEDSVTIRIADVRAEVFSKNIGQFPYPDNDIDFPDETKRFIKTAFSIDEEVSE